MVIYISASKTLKSSTSGFTPGPGGVGWEGDGHVFCLYSLISLAVRGLSLLPSLCCSPYDHQMTIFSAQTQLHILNKLCCMLSGWATTFLTDSTSVNLHDKR
jgi:hypothetical protein